jgi:hypothetical protein
MADASYVKFDKRLREIERRHRKAAAGFVRLEERDGLLVPVEKPAFSRRRLSPRFFVFLLAGFLLFKGVLLATIGTISYSSRVDTLAEGTWAEQVGAWVMYPDQITLWIADLIHQII